VIAIAVAGVDDLDWIAGIESRNYGRSRAVAPARLREWHDANPLGFLIARDGGERCGHATILPLKPAMLRALMAGAKSENDIRGEDIFSPHDRSSVRTFYIESVIAESIEVFGEMVRMFNRQVTRLAQPELLEDVVVCPSTPAGDLLVMNLGFARVAESPFHVANYAELVRRTTLLRSRLGARRRSA
jgi:hypothetical protein